MSTQTTVLHTLRLPNTHEPRHGAPWVCFLSGVGFVDADQTEIVQTSSGQADVNGLISLSLTPNDQIDPADSFYLLTAANETWAFVVPDIGPVWLKTCLIESPQPGPVAVVGAAGPTGPIGPTGNTVGIIDGGASNTTYIIATVDGGASV